MPPSHRCSTTVVTYGLLALLSLVVPVRLGFSAEPPEPADPSEPWEVEVDPALNEQELDPALAAILIPDVPPEPEGPVVYGPVRITVHEDFEDGQYVGSPDSMAIRPRILEEHGNKFLRITGSASDQSGMGYCGGKCPQRNRSTISFTKEVSLANVSNRWTYGVDIRVLNISPRAADVNPMSVTVNTTAGYCGHRVQVFGPDSIYTSKQQGHYYFDRRLHGAAGSFNVDLGAYNLAQWHTVRLDAVFSKDPKVGRLSWYIDGKLRKTWTGNTHPTCGWLTPEVRMGLYGDYSTGIVDLDNIRIGPTLAGDASPTPPPDPTPAPPRVSLRAPTQLRGVTP